MSSDGNKYVDLAHLDFHVKLIARRWRLAPPVVGAFERALRQGFDPDLRSDAPLFRLMTPQHSVCHLAAAARKCAGVIRERRLRRRIEWTLELAGIKRNASGDLVMW